jgi:hypothetical protein
MTPSLDDHDLATLSPDTRSVIKELENLLENVYADLEVPRSKVRDLTARGRELAEEAARAGLPETGSYLQELNRLEEKINQTLDLKRLKQEGMVKAVRL